MVAPADEKSRNGSQRCPLVQDRTQVGFPPKPGILAEQMAQHLVMMNHCQYRRLSTQDEAARLRENAKMSGFHGEVRAAAHEECKECTSQGSADHAKVISGAHEVR